MRYIVFSAKDYLAVALFFGAMFFIGGYVFESKNTSPKSATIEEIIKDYESDRVVEGSLNRVYSAMNK